jgi:hypothetical protein
MTTPSDIYTRSLADARAILAAAGLHPDLLPRPMTAEEKEARRLDAVKHGRETP